MTAALAIAAVCIAVLAWAVWAQRREIDRQKSQWSKWHRAWARADSTLIDIQDATRNINHGTARKVYRMASAAIEGGE